MKLLVPLAGLIDKAAEQARLTKEIEKKSKELGGIEHLVEQSRNRKNELQAAIDQLQRQLHQIQAL